jgi:hypothetical protein
LPKASPMVLGAIDVHGRVLPVFNVRRRFLMPERQVRPGDWFVIAHTARHTVVLVVDESEEVVERPQTDDRSVDPDRSGSRSRRDDGHGRTREPVNERFRPPEKGNVGLKQKRGADSQVRPFTALTGLALPVADQSPSPSQPMRIWPERSPALPRSGHSPHGILPKVANRLDLLLNVRDHSFRVAHRGECFPNPTE